MDWEHAEAWLNRGTMSHVLRSEDNLQECALSFHHMTPKDQTWITNLGSLSSKPFCQPQNYIFKCRIIVNSQAWVAYLPSQNLGVRGQENLKFKTMLSYTDSWRLSWDTWETCLKLTNKMDISVQPSHSWAIDSVMTDCLLELLQAS